jgi:HSP20 family protein
MPAVNVEIQKPEAAALLGESMNGLFQQVRQRAYELFEQRGRAGGSELDDWLRAERDVICRPESSLVETEKEFRMEIAMPNVEAKDITISALPESIVVQARMTGAHEEEREVHCSRERRLFRRFDLMPGIDVEQVNATLQNGVLTIVAVKLPEVKERKIAVAV